MVGYFAIVYRAIYLEKHFKIKANILKTDKDFYYKLFNDYIPFHKTIGLELIEIGEGFAKIHVPFKADLIGNPKIKSLHGGVIGTAIDAAGGFAGMSVLNMLEDDIATIDMRVDYLRSIREKDIFVEGHVARNGKRIITTSMKAVLEDGTLVAEGRGAYNVIRRGEKNEK